MSKNKNKSFRSCNQSCSDSVEFSDPLDENTETRNIEKEEKKKKRDKKKNKS